MKAIIAEDEPLLARQLGRLLARVWPELTIAATASNGVEALALIERERPQAAFLDIRMPGLSGLEVAAELADRLASIPALVFVTAYDEFALRAFDLAAVDYLLKPVTEERLRRTVEKLKKQQAPSVDALVAQLRQILSSQPPMGSGEILRTVRAGSGETVKMIPVAEVCYFRASDKYTAVVTKDGESLIRVPLKELLGRLPPEQFAQVHRGAVVNLAEVAAAVREDDGRLSLKLRHRKETLPVSRVYADLFRRM